MSRWCLVRWHEGRTSKVLLERDGRTFTEVDPVSGAAFCGPLSPCKMLEEAGLGSLGFPRGGVGSNLSLFDSEELAREHVEMIGDWISLDVPTPLELLHFRTEEYSHWDGTRRVIYDGGDYRVARGELALRLGDLVARPNGYLKTTIECRPLFDQLGRFRPTSAQAAAMFAVAEDLARRSVERMAESEAI